MDVVRQPYRARQCAPLGNRLRRLATTSRLVTRQLKMVHLEGPRQLKLGQLMAQFVHITLSRFNLFLSHIFLGFLASPARSFNIKCLAVVDDSIDRGSGRYGVKEYFVPFRVG